MAARYRTRKRPLSRNARNAPARPRKVDRRIRRTRDALGDALVGLIVEKPFASITVQDVLDRAGVARSTFYTHFKDKNDLFLSDVEEFFALMGTLLTRRRERSDRLAPVRELLAHIADTRDFYGALVASGRVRDVLDIGQESLARSIARRLQELPRSRTLDAKSRAAAAHMLAGALLSLMTWWIDRGAALSPEHMDELYHRLAWSGLAGRHA